VCPGCGAENTGTNPATCGSCNSIITSVLPTKSNKVKLLSVSSTTVDDINALEKTILDQQENPIPLTSYDIAFVVTGSGRTKNVSVVPMAQNNDVVTVPEDSLFEHSKAFVELKPAEIDELLRGVSLKDIFTARKVSVSEEEVLTTPEEEKVKQEIENRINTLFNQ
jgi:hypothetical protein